MTPPTGFGELVERLRRSTVLIATPGSRGSGSGVIIDTGGTIATNAHVARSARLSVQLHDWTRHQAVLIAHDREQDLALLSVRAGRLPALPLGDSLTLRPGDLVVAVGNPLGFIGAVTTGAVRGKGPLRGLGRGDWIQSDVRLAPGNSGGPLANAAGELVGLNSMIAGPLALAVPVNALTRLAAARQSRETLGVATEQVMISVRGTAQPGLLIMEIAGGSAAESASLLPGDIIIGADGIRLQSPADLTAKLEGHMERVLRIQFLRGDRSTIRTTSVLLGSSQSRAA